VAGVLTFSVCGSDPGNVEGAQVAQLTDAEVRAALEAGLEGQPDYPTSAEAATSIDVAANGTTLEALLPDVAAPSPALAPAPAVPRGEPSPAATSSGAGYDLQLASVRDPAATRSHWDAVRTQHPDLFSGLSPNVQTADLGDRGVYHRLRVGPFPDRASAARTCEAYKSRGGDCLVVAQ
jgi:cell division septation protein DedD